MKHHIVFIFIGTIIVAFANNDISSLRQYQVKKLRGLKDLITNNDTFQCSDNSDCSGPEQGICIRTGECICKDFYITFPENNQIKCNYRKKSLQTTLTAQLLMSGAGNILIGQNIRGSLQFIFGPILLIISLAILICICNMPASSSNPSGNCCTDMCGTPQFLCLVIFIIFMIVSVIFIFWGWVDAGLMAAGKIPDMNSVSLYVDN